VRLTREKDGDGGESHEVLWCNMVVILHISARRWETGYKRDNPTSLRSFFYGPKASVSILEDDKAYLNLLISKIHSSKTLL
jgi:hypothetical protein